MSLTVWVTCTECGAHMQVSAEQDGRRAKPSDTTCATCEYEDTDGEGRRVEFTELCAGDRVLFADRTRPCTVESITFEGLVEDRRAVPRVEGTIGVVAEALVSGPNGGRIRLELTDSGRVRAKLGTTSHVPPSTITDLRRVGGGDA